ncbi:MAG: ester cyclase [Chloroflexi bacterium]|nr:ester cyclase [Chloroflexota bacterium]
MSTEENKAILRQFFEAFWNNGNPNAFDEFFAAGWVHHNPPAGAEPNRDGFKQAMTAFRAAFADIHTTIDDMIADGDKVAWRWTFQGTHTDSLMGIPATSKQITLTGISIDRLAGGKSVERWDQADFLGMMQQIGAIPAPESQ